MTREDWEQVVHFAETVIIGVLLIVALAFMIGWCGTGSP